MMKSKLISAILLCLASLSASAWNVDVSPRTVAQVGTHTGTTGFVQLAEGVNSYCQNAILYFDVSTPLGKSIFATLVVAKTTGQKVHVAYTAPTTTGTCTLELAALV